MRSVSKGSNDPHRYDDMLSLPNHRSGTHRPLSSQQRAAQFLPFSALSGYEENIEESKRLTETRCIVSQEMKEKLDQTMHRIMTMDHPSVTITWFEEDLFKDGGTYRKKTGTIRRVEDTLGRIVFDDRTAIWFNSIDDIHIHEDKEQ